MNDRVRQTQLDGVGKMNELESRDPTNFPLHTHLRYMSVIWIYDMYGVRSSHVY